MTPFTVFATIEVPAEHMDRFEAALLAHRARCLSDEPGTLQFEVSRPADGENCFKLYEVYEDGGAFETHRTGDSNRLFAAEVRGIEVQVYAAWCVRLH